MPLPQHHPATSQDPAASLHHYRFETNFSWKSELRHLLSRKFLKIIFWPVFKWKQRHITYSGLFRQCSALPGFYKLWRCIQKGSFAYNSLFLNLSPFRKQAACTDLADLTTMALFFGDAFIDGLAEAAGKPFTLALIHQHPLLFHVRKSVRGNKTILECGEDLPALVDPDILAKTDGQYGISYLEFYNILIRFLQAINGMLGRLPEKKAQLTATKIEEACNTCFKSFFNDIRISAGHYTIQKPENILQSHELKTAAMQVKLLELRSILAEKQDVMVRIDTPGWLDIMRVVQIYDDIQDTLADHEVQDNLLLSVAYHQFPNEFEWFLKNKASIPAGKGNWLFVAGMPGSLAYCFQLAAQHIRTMNWEQQKIMHYLLRKTNYVMYCPGLPPDNCSLGQALHILYDRVNKPMMHLPERERKTFVIDCILHAPRLRRSLLKRLDITRAYQLRYNLFLVPASLKEEIFNQLV
jgi:hypothetical protein